MRSSLADAKKTGGAENMKKQITIAAAVLALFFGAAQSSLMALPMVIEPIAANVDPGEPFEQFLPERL